MTTAGDRYAHNMESPYVIEGRYFTFSQACGYLDRLGFSENDAILYCRRLWEDAHRKAK